MLPGEVLTSKTENRTGDLYREIGLQIRMARKRKGLTQDELSEKINLSRPSVANIEHGRHKFQMHVLYQISFALDCKVTDLLPKV